MQEAINIIQKKSKAITQSLQQDLNEQPNIPKFRAQLLQLAAESQITICSELIKEIQNATNK